MKNSKARLNKEFQEIIADMEKNGEKCAVHLTQNFKLKNILSTKKPILISNLSFFKLKIISKVKAQLVGEELTHWKGVIKGPDGGDFKLHFHQLTKMIFIILI